MVHDIENNIQGLGCSVVGNNCSQFMTSNKSSSVCDKKVGNQINDLEFSLSEQQVKDITTKWQDLNREPKDVIRGHFIFSAVYKYAIEFIKRYRPKKSISIDVMFSTFLLSFEQLFDEKHSHHNYYMTAIKEIKIIG